MQAIATADTHLRIKLAGGKPLFLAEKWQRVFGDVAVSDEDADGLRDSIARSGVESPILILDAPDYVVVLDGHRRVLAVNELLLAGTETASATGKPLTEIPWIAYQGPRDDLSIRAAILRANLCRRQVTSGQKRALVLTQLKVEADAGRFRTSKWIGEDLGVSHVWVQQVRVQAIADGALPKAPGGKYLDRRGRLVKGEIAKPQQTDEEPVLLPLTDTLETTEDEPLTWQERQALEKTSKGTPETGPEDDVETGPEDPTETGPEGDVETGPEDPRETGPEGGRDAAAGTQDAPEGGHDAAAGTLDAIQPYDSAAAAAHPLTEALVDFINHAKDVPDAAPVKYLYDRIPVAVTLDDLDQLLASMGVDATLLVNGFRSALRTRLKRKAK